MKSRATIGGESGPEAREVGRAHKGETVRLLIAEPNIRVVREDGVLLREVTLDRDRVYFGASWNVDNDVTHLSSMS